MNTYFITMITVVIVIAIFMAIFFFMNKLADKKVNVTGALKKVNTGITYAQALAQAISPFLPDVADNVIEIILKAGQQAVSHVEAIYKAAIATGQAAVDSRKDEATSLIKSALALEGIQETEQIDKLISAVLPVMVLALPKTHTAETDETVKTEAPDITQQKFEKVDNQQAPCAAENAESVKNQESGQSGAAPQSDSAVSAVPSAADTPAEPAAQAVSDTQNSVTEAAPPATGSSATPGTVTPDALSAAAKVLTAGVILLNNAVSKTPDTDNAALTDSMTAVHAAADATTPVQTSCDQQNAAVVPATVPAQA